MLHRVAIVRPEAVVSKNQAVTVASEVVEQAVLEWSRKCRFLWIEHCSVAGRGRVLSRQGVV